MQKVIIGIGLPGSGKTTLLKNFSEKYGYTYICPDDIRLELTGNAADQSKNNEVWEEARKRLESFFKSGKTVVFDSTMVDHFRRKEFLDFLRSLGVAKITGIFINLPAEIAKERNKKRERVVPDYAMERMIDELQAKESDFMDNFDSFFELDENFRLKEAKLKKKNPERFIEKKFIK